MDKELWTLQESIWSIWAWTLNLHFVCRSADIAGPETKHLNFKATEVLIWKYYMHDNIADCRMQSADYYCRFQWGANNQSTGSRIGGHRFLIQCAAYSDWISVGPYSCRSDGRWWSSLRRMWSLWDVRMELCRLYCRVHVLIKIVEY